MEQSKQTSFANQALVYKEGKYLTFALGNEEYGLEILKVREIIGYMDITAVPQTAHHVKGVINLRGQVNTAVNQMDKVTQVNAANAEESASASEELSAQAEQMNSILGDLSALVGGSSVTNSAGSSSTRKGLSAFDDTFHQIASGTSRQIDRTSEQSIPLNDSADFKGFNS